MNDVKNLFYIATHDYLPIAVICEIYGNTWEQNLYFEHGKQHTNNNTAGRIHANIINYLINHFMANINMDIWFLIQIIVIELLHTHPRINQVWETPL